MLFYRYWRRQPRVTWQKCHHPPAPCLPPPARVHHPLHASTTTCTLFTTSSTRSPPPACAHHPPHTCFETAGYSDPGDGADPPPPSRTRLAPPAPRLRAQGARLCRHVTQSSRGSKKKRVATSYPLFIGTSLPSSPICNAEHTYEDSYVCSTNSFFI
jgi:hypothetical protein